MEIRLNGNPHTLDGPATVAELLASLELTPASVAVAVNEEVVPRAVHGNRTLKAGDRVEIIQAVAGG